VAGDGTLVLPATATALDVSITPLDPSVDAAAASTARVLGNVYRFAVVDQAGDAATAPASALVTVVLRRPRRARRDARPARGRSLAAAQVEPMFGSTYVAVVTSFGDFAVIVPGASTPPSGGSSSQAGSPAAQRPRRPRVRAAANRRPPAAVVIGAIVVLVLLVIGPHRCSGTSRPRRPSQGGGW